MQCKKPLGGKSLRSSNLRHPPPNRAPLDEQDLSSYPNPLIPPPWIDDGRLASRSHRDARGALNRRPAAAGAGRPKRVSVPVMGLRLARECGFLGPAHAPRAAAAPPPTATKPRHIRNVVAAVNLVTGKARRPAEDAGAAPDAGLSWRDWDAAAAERYPGPTVDTAGNRVLSVSATRPPSTVQPQPAAAGAATETHPPARA